MWSGTTIRRVGVWYTHAAWSLLDLFVIMCGVRCAYKHRLIDLTILTGFGHGVSVCLIILSIVLMLAST